MLRSEYKDEEVLQITCEKLEIRNIAIQLFSIRLDLFRLSPCSILLSS